MDPIIPAFIGAAVAIAALWWMASARSPKTCGNCGRALPEMRRPATLEQAAWGGITCPGCGAELDAQGRVKKKAR
jgi:hypothetical protein